MLSKKSDNTFKKQIKLNATTLHQHYLERLYRKDIYSDYKIIASSEIKTMKIVNVSPRSVAYRDGKRRIDEFSFSRNTIFMNSITGIITTLNEEHNIADCIASLQLICNEIIVVDSLSNDKTTAIAESLGAKVYLQSLSRR